MTPLQPAQTSNTHQRTQEAPKPTVEPTPLLLPHTQTTRPSFSIIRKECNRTATNEK